jgi:hypothetical protein
MSGILAGCGGTQSQIPITPQTPTPLQSPNPFDSVSFPQDSCGDQPPDDPQAYPVEFYPVFVWTERDFFQQIQSHLCKNAHIGQAPFPLYDSSTRGKTLVILGYFITPKSANYFKQKITNKLNASIQIGSSYRVMASPSDIGHLAKLNDSQIQSLLNLDKNNRSRIPMKVILPTYIPNGYKVFSFEQGESFGGPEYRIKYRNSNNSCFMIHGNSGGWGGAPNDYQPLEVQSHALGKVILEKTEFDLFSNQANIMLVFEGGLLMSPQRYSFMTLRNDMCNPVKVQEAVKIVESFQYLNP